jgi:hypothetical protein
VQRPLPFRNNQASMKPLRSATADKLPPATRKLVFGPDARLPVLNRGLLARYLDHMEPKFNS